MRSASSTRTETGLANERVSRSSRTSTSSHISIPTLELEPGEPPPLERFCIAGTPEEVAERVLELWDAGADRVELGTPQGRTPLAGIDLVCERVLPLLRD